MKNIYCSLLFLFWGSVLSAQGNADFTFTPNNGCPGSNINFIDASTGPVVSYVWDFGDGNTSTVVNPTHVYTTNGNYTVCLTVTDANGESDTECQTLTVVQNIPTAVTEFICEGDNLFFNGQTYELPGFYVIELFGQSFNGCDSIIELQLNVLPTTNSFISGQLCEGGDFIFNGQPLDPGVHQFTYISQFGCDSIIIIEVIPVPSPESFFTQSICGGESIIINNTLYDLSNPSGIEVIPNGSFQGCDSIINVNLQAGLEVVAQVTPLACVGEEGNIEILIANGNPPYLYNWLDGNNNVISTSQNLTNITESGVYTLEVIDVDGCFSSTDFEVLAPDPIIVDAVINNTLCDVLFEGEISLQVTGGTGLYSYLWSTGENTPAVVGLPAGTYFLTLTDSNGCTFTNSYSIVETTPLNLDITSSEIVCSNEGFININPVGGTAPYEFLWSTGETTQNLSDIIAGTYTISVWDNNGCMTTETIVIVSPIDLTVESTFADCDSTNATATAILDGVSDAAFLWSNGGTSATQNDLAPGWYSVTVTDQTNDCATHENIQVLEDTICYVFISGFVYLDDVDPDCVVDPSTVAAPNVMVGLSDGQNTFTNSDGYYEFLTDAGTYDISVNYTQGFYEDLCTDDLTVDADIWGQTYPNNNFYLSYNEGRDLKLKVNKQNARPGFTQYVSICLMNVGAVPVSGTLTFVHPDIQIYQTSSIIPTSYDSGTQTLTWDFEDIPPGAVFVYTTYLTTPVGTPLGTLLEYDFQATPIAGDLTPENNEINCSLAVTGSYDPNDKQVEPLGFGPDGGISMADTLLSYKIRFQNTGTDTAFTVLIRDTLDQNLDVRTIVPGPSSHAYSATLRDNNILELLFENILLPDSFVNEPASNGFVYFDIELNPNLPYETRIENRAGIYFDFNPPIITNTVVNTIQMLTGLDIVDDVAIPISLNPNPVEAESLLEYHLPKSGKVSISIYDLSGRQRQVLIDQNQQSAGVQQLLLRDLQLPQGVYTIQIKTEEGERGILKFVHL